MPCEGHRLQWNHLTRIEHTPAASIKAIVVDATSKGAIRIFEKGKDERIDSVGMQEDGQMVLIPWNSNWWFRVSGTLRIGFLEEK